MWFFNFNSKWTLESNLFTRISFFLAYYLIWFNDKFSLFMRFLNRDFGKESKISFSCVFHLKSPFIKCLDILIKAIHFPRQRSIKLYVKIATVNKNHFHLVSLKMYCNLAVFIHEERYFVAISSQKKKKQTIFVCHSCQVCRDWNQKLSLIIRCIWFSFHNWRVYLVHIY